MDFPIFDSHVHMDSRSANDYELMALTGVERLLIPCTFTGERRRTASDYLRYFERLLGFERQRAAAFGIKASFALGINTGDVADWTCVDEAVDAMGALLHQEQVVAIGELGFKDFVADEVALFHAQLKLAKRHRLPVIVEAPWRHGREALERTAQIIADAIEAEAFESSRLALMDVHVEQLPVVWSLDLGGYGIPVAPRHDLPFALHRKAGPKEVQQAVAQYGDTRLLINSALHFGVGDPMGIARTLLALRMAGLPRDTLKRIAYDNAVSLFGSA